jgi:hypothetical protein
LFDPAVVEPAVEQVQTFRTVASQLRPGGFFVIENYVPELRRLPPGETVHLFTATPTHVGFEEYDVAAQIAISHHCWVIGDEFRPLSSLRVAVRTGSHGAARRNEPPRAMERLEPRGFHEREP